MGKQDEQRVQAFSLRIDEVRLLANYRQLPPSDKRASVAAMEEYLSRIRPQKAINKSGGDHQWETTA